MTTNTIVVILYEQLFYVNFFIFVTQSLFDFAASRDDSELFG